MFWHKFRSKQEEPIPVGDRRRLGEWGEARCAEYLHREKGMRILARNWKAPPGELDLVCMEDGVLVFVEVKTRPEGALVSGYFSVTKKKKRVLLTACKAYLRSLKQPPSTFRFDIVEVRFCQSGKFTISHYPNIPLFPKFFHCDRH